MFLHFQVVWFRFDQYTGPFPAPLFGEGEATGYAYCEGLDEAELVAAARAASQIAQDKRNLGSVELKACPHPRSIACSRSASTRRWRPSPDELSPAICLSDDARF